ncbi:MAG: hypothetical protein ACUVS7_02245 [Bryobacteraceae bacterium]
MRRSLIVWLACAAVWGQQRETRTFVFDPNGRRTEWSVATRGQSSSSETIRNLNGRQVPVEQTEERVTRRPDGTVVTERLIRRFDNNGALLPPEKTVTETLTRPDGTTVEVSTIYRGDINGRLRPAEKAVLEARKEGDRTVSETRVERPSINGSFELLEKRTATEVIREEDKSSQRDETVYVRDANGVFVPAQRRVTRARESGGKLEQQVEEYEAATTGSLRLSRQISSVTQKNPDGTENTVVDVYGVAAPGRTIEAGAAPQLRERRLFSSRQSADGTVVTVFSVQRPSLNSPKELGRPEVVSETITRVKK